MARKKAARHGNLKLVKRSPRKRQDRLGTMMDNISNVSEELGMLKERNAILKVYMEVDAETFQAWLYQRCKV